MFQDESGLSQRPCVRRTWSPKGQTPVLTHSFNWKNLSLSAATAYRWNGKQARLLFEMKPGTYNTESLIAFLKQLRRHFKKKVILIWDGLPSHRSRDMKEFLQTQKHWLSVERLPSYAPDMNPVESLWANIKGQELANHCASNIASLEELATIALKRAQKNNNILFGFLRHAQLYF